MARSGISDPFDKYRWTIAIDGFSRLGFTSTTTPAYNITEKKYAEGGRHLNPLSIIDKVDYVPVTLSRGVTNDTSFNKWATSFIDLVTNNAVFPKLDPEPEPPEGDFAALAGAFAASADNGAKSVPSNDKYPFRFRRKVKIEHVNRAGQVEVMYILYNAYPIAYKPASDFDSQGDDGLSIESITLAYEGFETKYAGLKAFLGNILLGEVI